VLAGIGQFATRTTIFFEVLAAAKIREYHASAFSLVIEKK
jgi:hypothetical protein